MNKKLLIVGSLVTAFLVLTVTVFAGTETYEGYEEFKALMKNHEEGEYESGTLTGNFEVTDNGELLIEVTTELSGNQDAEEVSGVINIKAEGIDKTLEFYGADEKFYVLDVKNNDVYIGTHDEEMDSEDRHNQFKKDFHDYHEDDEMADTQEAFLDYMMDDYKDDFSVSKNSDGTKDITFELTKDEIPVALNLLISAASENRHKDGYHEEMADEYEEISGYPLFEELSSLKGIHENKIVTNHELEYVLITVVVDEDDNFLESNFEVTHTGEDEEGNSHEITVKGSVEVTELNEAVVEPISLEGRNVYELPEHVE